MPKEFTEDTRATHGSDGIAAGSGLSVRWRKQGTAHGGSPIIHPLVVTYDRPDSRMDGIGAIVALDRAGCNRLIRALRKARDDVFGRDE